METTGLNYNPHSMIELRDLSSGSEKFAYFKATELEGMREQLKELQDVLNATQKQYEDVSVSNRYWISKAEEFLTVTREWLTELVDSGDLDFDTAVEFAEKLGIDIKRKYEVTIQVEYSFIVNAKNEYEVEDILDNLDIPSISDDAICDWDVSGDIVSRDYSLTED